MSAPTPVGLQGLRALKRELIVLIRLATSKATKINAANYNEVKNRISELKQELRSAPISINEEDRVQILSRRSILGANKSLCDIFASIWLAIFHMTEEGVLTDSGFIKFHSLLVRALEGRSIITAGGDSAEDTETDLVYAKAVYGLLNNEGFFDYLLETIGIAALIVSFVRNASCFSYP